MMVPVAMISPITCSGATGVLVPIPTLPSALTRTRSVDAVAIPSVSLNGLNSPVPKFDVNATLGDVALATAATSRSEVMFDALNDPVVILSATRVPLLTFPINDPRNSGAVTEDDAFTELTDTFPVSDAEVPLRLPSSVGAVTFAGQGRRRSSQVTQHCRSSY